jgi:hypothetical protein
VRCAVLGVIGLSVALVAATGRQAFEANLLRLRGSRVRPDLEVRISVSVAGDAENAKVVTGRFLHPSTGFSLSASIHISHRLHRQSMRGLNRFVLARARGKSASTPRWVAGAGAGV